LLGVGVSANSNTNNKLAHVATRLVSLFNCTSSRSNWR